MSATTVPVVRAGVHERHGRLDGEWKDLLLGDAATEP
jgi:hypothetical protein